jgi:hypothetical protein
MSTSIARPRTTRARTERKPRWLRARVWLNRRALDRRLAEGMLPASSPELDYRAEQLLSSRYRRSFATGIKRIIEAGEDGLQVRGLALVEPFLTSANSPLFHPSPEETLERTVRRIRAALLLR